MKFFNKKTNYEKQRGFSLLELIVSVGLFSVVITIALGSLLSVVNANKKSRSLQLVMDNVNFALDDMSRTIRFGDLYRCHNSESNLLSSVSAPRNCSSGNNSFLAIEGVGGDQLVDGDQLVYKLESGQIVKSLDGGSTYTPVTSPEVDITRLLFYVEGAESDTEQAKVRMVVEGIVNEGTVKTESDFAIQTTVAQRDLPFTITTITPNDTNFSSCPFNMETDRLIVDYSEDRNGNTLIIESPSGWQKVGAPIELPTPIPPGVYDISLAAFDEHQPGDQHDNPAEFVRAELLSYGKSVFVTNRTTIDIPLALNVVSEKVNTNALIPETITHFVPIPAFDPLDPAITDTSSVVLICAAFDNVGPADINTEEF